MSRKGYKDELARALARPDAAEICRAIDAQVGYFARGNGKSFEDLACEFEEITPSFLHDPDKALAYVILTASRTDNGSFLRYMGCGPLEDMLRDPSDELLLRIVAEARKSDRFRWLLSNPFKVAIAPRAWDAIQKFRITGPHEEPSADKLPPRP